MLVFFKGADATAWPRMHATWQDRVAMHTVGNIWRIFQNFPPRSSRGVGMEKVPQAGVLCVLCVGEGVSANVDQA